MFRGPDVTSVTVGIDIGTTSVKAVAVDDRGEVVARSRIPHEILVPAPDRLEHDASRAWRRGPLRALAALGDVGAKAVGVAAMVPSMTAVDTKGRPMTPGLLYGDERGRSSANGRPGPEGNGEVLGFLRWTAEAAPGAIGYWPAQAVATRALGGTAAVDLAVAFTSSPLYGAHGWDAGLCTACGATVDQLPAVEVSGAAVGKVGADGPLLTAGSVDVWCEQLVAGADNEGDVHVICGTSLIVWAVASKIRDDDTSTGGPDPPGLWTFGHRTPGLSLVGGASNAGGLFLDWAARLGGRPRSAELLDPANIPVWSPYPRGERTPYHDPDRRADLHGLDLTHGPAALRRASWEAAGFVVRHHLELAGVRPTRIVATGGGTLVDGWMQALADTTATPVHVAASPDGAARGAAFLARLTAGLDRDLKEASRWARTARIVEPEPRWAAAAAARYGAFLEFSGPTSPSA